ncbi:MAG: asparagine synthase (glutamine-hydrolyzing) [Gammaproteobacteria bacterium]
MCGIAGIFHLDGQRPAVDALVRHMTESLVHRGPDGSGCFTRGNVSLGHRRLSIIDLATGDQPFVSEDQSQVLVYNGELYNYIEIRQQLKSLGRRFRTESDTEVILQAYDEWGTDCLSRFNGMWAFALWDEKRKRLFCARDRLGEKPFYYALWNNSFLFGSEMKALFAAGVPREINEEMLDAILCFGYLPAPYTFYKSVHKLPAGCYMTVQEGRGVQVERYWQVPSRLAGELRTDGPAVRSEFEALFVDSVRLRLRSDVPVGAFLSGGLDSASVVAAMSSASSARVNTCTIGFDPSGNDERSLARLVAHSFNTNHVDVLLGREHAEQLIEKIAWHFDEPFGDTSTVPTYEVSRIARGLVTVVLTGDGGDEVLSGYPSHQREKLMSWWTHVPSLIRRPLISAAEGALFMADHRGQRRGVQRARRVLASVNADFVSRLESKQIGLSGEQRRMLLGGNPRVRPAREFIEEAIAPAAARDGLGLLSFWLHAVALPERYLCKVDRCSMAHSLEARVPFLDHRIVELLANVSSQVKMPGLKRKDVLRRTIGKRLPQPLLTAGKRGFDAPMDDWLTRDNNELWRVGEAKLRASGLFASEGLAWFQQLERGPNNLALGRWMLSMLALQMAESSRRKAA